MRNRHAFVLLVGLVPMAALPAAAQEFKLQEVGSLNDVPIAQLKPKSIVFTDRRKDEVADPDSGLLPFEDWAKTRPAQKAALGLFPSYNEPTIITTVDGFTKRQKEKLHLYVAEARVL